MRTDATDSPYLYVLRRLSLTYVALCVILLILMSANVIGLPGLLAAAAVGMIMFLSAAWFGRSLRIAGGQSRGMP